MYKYKRYISLNDVKIYQPKVNTTPRIIRLIEIFLKYLFKKNYFFLQIFAKNTIRNKKRYKFN